MNAIIDLPEESFVALKPSIYRETTVRTYDGSLVAWSEAGSGPIPLDGVAAVIFQILDGTATVRELIADIHDVVGVAESVAAAQLRAVLNQLQQAGLLDGVPAALGETPRKFDYFPAPPNP